MALYQIAARQSFLATHSLHFPDGRTEKRHQHRWAAEIVVQSPHLDPAGMVMDFQLLNSLLSHALQPITTASAVNDLVPHTLPNASTESLARYLFHAVQPHLPSAVRLAHVTVWETPSCWARYLPHDPADPASRS